MSADVYRNHPALFKTVTKLIEALNMAGRSLCSNQIRNYGVSTKHEKDNYDPQALSYNCVLTSDNKSGIIPFWFVVYRYNNLSPEVKEAAKAAMIGPKALQSVNAKELREHVKSLVVFENMYKSSRYMDANFKNSKKFLELTSVVKQTLFQLEPLVTGEFHQKNPENGEPDDRIAYFDLYLKDPSDVDDDGVYLTKIRWIIATPEFIDYCLKLNAT